MKTAVLIALLVSTFSVFAEVIVREDGTSPNQDLPVHKAVISEEEVALMRALYEENGAYTQEDFGRYVETVQYIKRRGYNMGPYSKYAIMQGRPIPRDGQTFNFGPCNRTMIRDEYTAGWIRTPGGRFRNPAYIVQPGGQRCAKL